MSRSRCEPRSTSSTDSGSPSRASTAATAEQMIWPPWAMARIRATRLRAGPKKSPSRASAAPAWSAIRTRNGPVSSQVASRSARWAATAASMAATASAKTASIPSPVVLITLPPCASTLARRSRSCWASAGPIRSACSSQRRVLPSMSVNRKVETALSDVGRAGRRRRDRVDRRGRGPGRRGGRHPAMLPPRDAANEGGVRPCPALSRGRSWSRCRPRCRRRRQASTTMARTGRGPCGHRRRARPRRGPRPDRAAPRQRTVRDGRAAATAARVTAEGRARPTTGSTTSRCRSGRRSGRHVMDRVVVDRRGRCC